MFNIGSKAEQTTLLAWIVSSEDYPYLQWVLFQKKSSRVGGLRDDTLFWKKNLKFLDLSFYP